MITLLRKIRMSLIRSESFHKYLLYALGEILLVMIGILLALQVNNWNENRKVKNAFSQSMLSLAEDIRNDTTILQRYIARLQTQERAAKLIIPVLENRADISDSSAFYAAFLEMSNAVNMDLNTEVWDDLRRSGLTKIFADPHLVESIQNYYHRYHRACQNWENEKAPRIEMRGLKYGLMDQTDLEKLRGADAYNLPSLNALTAIMNERRIVSLTKRIDHTSTLFARLFGGIKLQAVEVLKMIEDGYGTDSKDVVDKG